MSVHPGNSPLVDNDFDVCIVGAGAAGIVLALELAESSLSVVVLEGGDDAPHGDNRPSYLARAGNPIELRDGAPFYFGGNTNHWYGNCRPLDDDDYERREWIPRSGWPIAPAEVSRFLPRAQRHAGLGDVRWYDVDQCRHKLRYRPAEVRQDVLETRIVQTTPIFEFPKMHHEGLAAADNVHIALQRRVTRLVADGAGHSVVGVESVGPDGLTAVTAARFVVLAAGGVENPRLMLCSPDVLSNRDGDEPGPVGRYFMEHFFFAFGPDETGYADARSRGSLRLYEDRTVGEKGRELGLKSRQTVGDAKVWGQLVISEDLKRRERAPGLSIWFRPVSAMPPSVRAIRGLVEAARTRSSPPNLRAQLRSAFEDPRATARFLAWKLAGIGAPSDLCEMIVQIEHAPDPDNGVHLTEETDGALVPRAQLSLAIDDGQIDAHSRTLHVACDELGLDGAEVARQFRRKFVEHDFGFFDHHMGTTRMSDDATAGVVDRDCKVYGTENLFVAGSSVFPTGGTAPPTLMVMALAVRLADHLRRLAEA